MQIIVYLLQLGLFGFSDGTSCDSSSDADATIYNAEVLFVRPGNK